MSALLKSRVTHPASLLCPAPNHELHVLCRPSSAGASQLRSWSLWSISRLFHWWFYFSPWAVTFIRILPTSNRQPEHLPSFSLVQATCLAQIGQFPLPVCALPPTRFSCIGERYFYTPTGGRENLGVAWNLPISLTFSVQPADRLHQLHILQRLNLSTFLLPSLSPCPSNLSPFTTLSFNNLSHLLST